MRSTPTRRSKYRGSSGKRFWILGLLVVLFAGGIFFGLYMNHLSQEDVGTANEENNKENNADNVENNGTNDEGNNEGNGLDPEPEETFTEITLAAAGDIMAHDDQIESALVTDGAYDFNPMFKDVKPILSEADLTLANFETTTGGADLGYSGFPIFNSPDELIDAVSYAGVDVLTTANNHSLDTRDTGLIRTVQEIRERGIDTVGTYVDGSEERILVKDVDGITFGILSYTESTNGLGEQYDPEYLDSILNLMTKENISRDIEAAKAADVDFIITFMHWGEEYMTEPNATQVEYAEFMAEEGVDLILGSHPHVIQKSDVIETEDGAETYVIYSLGNFISNQRVETLGEEYANTEDGIIVNFDIEKNDLTGETKITDVEYIPTWVYRGREEGRESCNYCILPIENFLVDDAISDTYKARMERSYESTISRMYDFSPVEL